MVSALQCREGGKNNPVSVVLNYVSARCARPLPAPALCWWVQTRNCPPWKVLAPSLSYQWGNGGAQSRSWWRWGSSPVRTVPRPQEEELCQSREKGAAVQRPGGEDKVGCHLRTLEQGAKCRGAASELGRAGGQATLWHLELCKGHWRRLLAWPSPHQQGLFSSAGYAQTFKPASPSGPCPPHLCTALSKKPSLQIGTLRQILCRGLYPPWVLEGESRGLPTRGLIKAAAGVKIHWFPVL